jgi:hypothetical protein|mmetsp:Transcript_6336/g.26911  ORF Transcript_6336/g.26911 Transcript_6336/m.26911 type:complete len:146 (+) Transcript_6336:104-541(+)
MGSVNKSNDSSVRKFLGIHVRVFWCLALICALEVLLWSFCLFGSQSSGAAQAYYTRETVNLKSTTGETVRVPTPPVDYRSLELALKAESAWQQRARESFYATAPPRVAQLAAQWATSRSAPFGESLRYTEGAPSEPDVARIGVRL